MMESPEPEPTQQAELEGMPDPEAPKTYWFDVVDVGLTFFTTAMAAIRVTSFIPYLPRDLTPERLREIEEDLSRVYMQEVGRERWEAAMAESTRLIVDLYDAAREAGTLREWKLEIEKAKP